MQPVSLWQYWSAYITYTELSLLFLGIDSVRGVFASVSLPSFAQVEYQTKQSSLIPQV